MIRKLIDPIDSVLNNNISKERKRFRKKVHGGFTVIALVFVLRLLYPFLMFREDIMDGRVLPTKARDVNSSPWHVVCLLQLETRHYVENMPVELCTICLEEFVAGSSYRVLGHRGDNKWIETTNSTRILRSRLSHVRAF